MHEGAGERHFCALALRKTLGAPVGEIADVEQAHDLVNTIVDLGFGEAAEFGEIGDVFPRGQVRVKARAMWQSADALARLEAVLHYIHAIDRCRAFVRLQNRVEDA